MALTKSILTGRVVLPTDAAPINAELVFTLSGLDSEGGDILPPGDPARCVLINGELPPGYSIWRNTKRPLIRLPWTAKIAGFSIRTPFSAIRLGAWPAQWRIPQAPLYG